MNRVVDDASIVQDVIGRDVPMLSADWGTKDEDALLHTLGINLFAGLARAAGYVGLAEYPVPRAPSVAAQACSRRFSMVRSSKAPAGCAGRI